MNCTCAKSEIVCLHKIDSVTEEELEAVREIVRITGIIPTRSWNLNNNFHGYTFNTDDPLLQGEPDTVRILNEIKEDYGE